MSNRALVLDANILIRAVLGIRVRRILENYANGISFFVPEVALSEAKEHLAALVTRRGGDPAKALRLLDAIVGLVDLVSSDVYGEHETEARRRIGSRDPDDWPKTPTSSVVALRPGHQTTSRSSCAIKVRARDSSHSTATADSTSCSHS